MKLLVDADFFVYRISSACNNNRWNYRGKIFDNKWSANKAAKKHGEGDDKILFVPEPESREDTKKTVLSYIEGILDPFPLYDTKFFISSPGNFRYKVATIQKYKGNRDGKVKPFHYQYVRDLIIDLYDAHLSHPLLETDDEISCRQRSNGETVILSLDKDFLQLEGMHYNWDLEACRYITKVEGLRNFYTQVLMGDTADHIPGIFGVGEKSVHIKKLDELDNEKDMFHHCLEVYTSHYRSYAEQFMLENIQLLYLVRENKAYWKDYFNIKRTYWEYV